MAKKNKKPNHSRLVVPGGASIGARKPKPRQSPEDTQEQAAPRLDNTIDLTKDGAAIRKKVARRRKRRHGLQFLLLAAVFVGVLALYFSGISRSIVLKATDIAEGISISLKGSGSFPLGFDISGYIESDNLGKNGIVVLGEKDMVVISATGRELYRVQHGYGNPHVTASDTRICLYNRGGNEYTIEGRDSRVTSRTTERDILFAEMSPNGALALATASRFRASIEIYSNFGDDEPQFSWEITDEKPYAATFMSDNKHLALACVSTEGGAIHSNIYLLHANRSEVQATINGGAATVLDIEYLSSNKILVIYDSYAALYNGSGEQLARYDFAGQDIVALDSRGGTTVLVFGSVSGNSVTAVLLDSSLEVTGTMAMATAESPRVLVDGKTVYLLTGYEVAAFNLAGEALNTHTGEYKGHDLAWAGEALLITAGDVQSLGWMSSPEEEPAEEVAGGVDEDETPGAEIASQPETEPASAPASAPEPEDPESAPDTGAEDMTPNP